MIDQQMAIRVARNHVSYLDLPPDDHIVVELIENGYVVTWQSGRGSVPGGGYAAQVTVDAITGRVVKALQAP